MQAFGLLKDSSLVSGTWEAMLWTENLNVLGWVDAGETGRGKETTEEPLSVAGEKALT